MCAADGAGKYADFFEYDWGKQGWNLMVALGAMFGGYIAANYFGGDGMAHVSQAAVDTLNQISRQDLFTTENVPIVPDQDVIHEQIPDFWNVSLSVFPYVRNYNDWCSSRTHYYSTF